MAYHDDLLTQAGELIHRNEQKSTQADLRRAVSTAYYALFHLLIGETTLNWSRDSSRYAFGRMFDHALMRKASQRLLDSRLFPFAAEDPKLVQDPKTIAQAFVQLQDKRHIADYHNGVRWTHVESLREVATARKAFQLWASGPMPFGPVKKKREAVIILRLLPEEKVAIAAQAERGGLTVSEYIRRQAMGKPVKSRMNEKAINELRRLGGLQKHLATKYQHKKDALDEVLVEIQSAIQRLDRQEEEVSQ